MNGALPALVLHSDCALHDTGWGHPEHMGRLPAIVAAIERDSPALIDRIAQRQPSPASESAILRVHDAGYVAYVRQTAARSVAERALLHLDPDTVVSPASWNAALAAAGCIVEAASLVARGDSPSAFALSRPPGHHALPGVAMGFCLFNNVAVAARALQAEHGVGRVLIIDWDVLHGNGTQDVFYEDPSVYYLSLHQSPWYPGTGRPDERGAGSGRGTNRNVTLAAGTSAVDYLSAFEAALDATLAEFQPEMILVSSGFDCMRGDPLGRLLLEPRDLHAMTRMVLERARACGAVGPAFTVEGGYAPERVGAGVVDVLRALAGLPPHD
ncbi:MAG: histone deacetylase family protein [Longimicrobiales bacterium]